MTEAGFTEGRKLIVIGQVRVDYETEIHDKVNWCQTNIRSKWKRMTSKFGKLLWPADETHVTLDSRRVPRQSSKTSQQLAFYQGKLAVHTTRDAESQDLQLKAV